MKDKQNRHIVDILFVIALFSIFVLSAIFLISIGAGIYSKTMSNMDSNFTSRTAVAYIVEKVHQSDTEGLVTVDEFDGCRAIVITSYVNDREYKTYLYEYKGMLKELMVRSDVTLSASAGQDILAVRTFVPEIRDESLLTCGLLMENGEKYDFCIDLHSIPEEGGVDE